ncbi:MAG: sodium:solute symporter [Bacteroidota bacterium]
MSPILLLSIVVSYFLLLILISSLTSRGADNASFFIGNRRSPWYLVAFGMIGATLSGVTFISVPGWVGSSQFSYLQMVLGYLVGYYIIANLLMPLYYKLKLTSIYTYLDTRFGKFSYKTGASFFLLSRIVGASFRLFLVANVLQFTVFQNWGVPFEITVLVTILFIWLYTFRGGIKTIVWTDSLQTFSMLLAVIISVILISRQMDLNLSEMTSLIKESDYSRIWIFEDWKNEYHFLKQFLGGVFITIVMTGLDQDMMQKNLSCKNIREAKKNMYWMSISLLPVNFLFLSLGALLFIYARQMNIPIPEQTDNLFPLIATGGYLPPILGIFFIIGLIAAAYSSADSALTSLTTSFTIDILEADKREPEKLEKTRIRVHIFLSFVLMGVILIFRAINDENVISAIFTVAGYTYGPLLGLYAFGLFTRLKVKDILVPLVAVISPLLTYIINIHSETLLWGYVFGFELLLVNGLLTFSGLLLIARSRTD